MSQGLHPEWKVMLSMDFCHGWAIIVWFPWWVALVIRLLKECHCHDVDCLFLSMVRELTVKYEYSFWNILYGSNYFQKYLFSASLQVAFPTTYCLLMWCKISTSTKNLSLDEKGKIWIDSQLLSSIDRFQDTEKLCLLWFLCLN